VLHSPGRGLPLQRRLLQRSRTVAVLQRQLLHLQRVQLQDDRRLLFPVGLHRRRLQLIVAQRTSVASRSSAISRLSIAGPKEKRTWRRKREARWLRRLPGLTSKNSPGTTITCLSSAARKKPMPSSSGGGKETPLAHTQNVASGRPRH